VPAVDCLLDFKLSSLVILICLIVLRRHGTDITAAVLYGQDANSPTGQSSANRQD